MKKISFYMIVMVMALTSIQYASAKKVAKTCTGTKVAYTELRNYFVSNRDITKATTLTVTDGELFDKTFGMAAVMGANGQPTHVDFSKQMVLAVILPETDHSTQITPVSLVKKARQLVYSYRIKRGVKMTYTILPFHAIVVNKSNLPVKFQKVK
jgi:hypothetical protein